MSPEAGLASVATESPLDGDAEGTAIGGWTVGPRLRRTLIAQVYRASRGDQEATVHVVHPELAQLREVVTAVQMRAPKISQLVDHRNVSPTFGAGFEDGYLYVITEPEDGPVLRDILDRKHAATSVGLPPRGAGNVIALVAQGLVSTGGLFHGALGDESVTVSRSGRIAIADLALGPALCAAIAAGAVKAPGWIAPEVQRGEPAGPASDVYGLGALLYDTLVGQPLTRGGPRPSEAAPGIPPEVDEIIARACAEKPDRRFSSVDSLRELVMDVLCRGVEEEEEQVGADAAPAGVATAPPRVNLTIAPALEAAMEDPHERWLVTKGRFDFGPFSMKGLVDQITTGHVHHGNVLFDKDDGGRMKVEDHPLLGPLVEAARQQRDDARRAHAEVKHQSSERKRGVTLYGFIGAGVLAAVVAVYFIITALAAAKNKKIEGVDTLASANLNVTVSEPKKPAKKPRSGGNRRSGGGGGGLPGGNDSLTLDLSDDSDEGSATLDMGTVFSVYSRFGNRLGGCLLKTGASSAAISIIIDGPSGKVNWMKVNGESSGALHSCLSGVMRAMKFPSIDGPRTRAEFDIAI